MPQALFTSVKHISQTVQQTHFGWAPNLIGLKTSRSMSAFNVKPKPFWFDRTLCTTSNPTHQSVKQFRFFFYPFIIKLHKKLTLPTPLNKDIQLESRGLWLPSLRHQPGDAPRHGKSGFHKITLPSVFQICNPIASHQPTGHRHKRGLSAPFPKFRVYSTAFLKGLRHNR